MVIAAAAAAAAAAANISGGNNNGSCLSYVSRDQAVSNGVLQGDNPTHFALPLLIIQIAVVLATTRSMAFLIKPFHQPRVLAEVIGGVLLGPSGLGRNGAYLEAVFPKQSLTTIDTVSTLGLLFFLFMVGLELDLKEIRKCGRNALLTALSGVAVPFVAGVAVSILIHRTLSPSAKFAPLVVFVGVPISITAFPVLVRIMAERKLLGTELGKIVLPAAAINDVCAWILLAVGVALAGPSSSPATPAYVLLLGLAYVMFMLVIARRVMVKIAHRACGEEGSVKEIYVCVTMVAVLVAGFTTDAIGIHPLFGAFVFGLVVPKEGKFAQMLTEKIEDFVTVLMLPLFFASSGLKTNLGSINSARAVGLLVLLVLTATVGKISATVTAALLMKMDLRKGFAFGFLMNTKGLVELIVLNIGKDIGVLDDQTFAILVLTCLIILFFTTPAVMALYKPARNPLPYLNRKLEGKDGKRVADAELRVLACVHGTKPIPAFVNLVEALSKGTCNDNNTKKQFKKNKKKGLKIFAMHLLELSDRPSSIMSLSRDTNGHDEDPVLVAFQGYARFSAVRTKLLRVVSELSDMHEDVCNIAAEKRATIIIMPFNIYVKDDGWSIENKNQGFSGVNQRVLQHAPCSVGILVDRGQVWGSTQLSSSPPYNIVHVGVAFFGGPDDREALAFACLLAEHPSLEVYVMRFVKSNGGSENRLLPCVVNVGDIDDSCSLGLDEQALSLVKKHVRVVYEEHGYNDDEEVRSAMVRVVVTRTKDFALVVVGKGGHGWDIEKGAESSNCSGELGVMGDALTSAHIKSSFLVIQQHRSPNLSNHKT